MTIEAGGSPINATQKAAMRSGIGLGNVDNTADANKPVSVAQAAAIGVALSAAQTAQATANAAAPANSLALVATSGAYNDLTGKPALGDIEMNYDPLAYYILARN